MNISLPVELWMLTSSPGKDVKEVDAFLTFAIFLNQNKEGGGAIPPGSSPRSATTEFSNGSFNRLTHSARNSLRIR